MDAAGPNVGPSTLAGPAVIPAHMLPALVLVPPCLLLVLSLYSAGSVEMSGPRLIQVHSKFCTVAQTLFLLGMSVMLEKKNRSYMWAVIEDHRRHSYKDI